MLSIAVGHFGVPAFFGAVPTRATRMVVSFGTCRLGAPGCDAKRLSGAPTTWSWIYVCVNSSSSKKGSVYCRHARNMHRHIQLCHNMTVIIESCVQLRGKDVQTTDFHCAQHCFLVSSQVRATWNVLPHRVLRRGMLIQQVSAKSGACSPAVVA